MEHDVIVVGGGLAGVTAARDLGQGGHSVLLLEARDRLGGRVFYRSFADTGREVEFGGTWFGPELQKHITREVNRYGLRVTSSPEPRSFSYLAGGRRLTVADPVSPEERPELKRALASFEEASRRLDRSAPLTRPPADLDVPFSDFIDSLSLPQTTSDYLTARIEAEVLGCSAPEASTLYFLKDLANLDYDAHVWFDGELLGGKLADGTRSLVEAMAGESEAEIRLSTPVRRVEQDSSSVRVTTEAGQMHESRAAVVAVPLNVLGDIHFSPPLSEGKRVVAREGHAGRAVKLWALVEGVPPYLFASGTGPAGLRWLSSEYDLPEGSLMVGFSVGPERLKVEGRALVQHAIEAFAPGARVLNIDAHDWEEDPYSKGAWVCYRPGQLSRFGPTLGESEGRLAFAGSDTATGWTGWIDGAIESGERAAEYVDRLLEKHAS